MNKDYTNELSLPANCAVIDNQEMRYICGGLAYKLRYMYTGGAMAKALEYKNWKNISTFDLAAEIWFHAYAYYNAAPMIAVCNLLGFKGIANTNLWKSLKNGIDIANGLDTKKELGVPRYQIFRAAYAYAVANPAIV